MRHFYLFENDQYRLTPLPFSERFPLARRVQQKESESISQMGRARIAKTRKEHKYLSGGRGTGGGI